MNNENKVEIKVSWLSWFLLVLQLIFITLKLCGVIAWSWVCVFIPLIALGGILIIDIILLIVLFIFWKKHNDKGD